MIVFFLHYLESCPCWSLSHEAHLHRVLFLDLYGSLRYMKFGGVTWYCSLIFFFLLGTSFTSVFEEFFLVLSSL